MITLLDDTYEDREFEFELAIKKTMTCLVESKLWTRSRISLKPERVPTSSGGIKPISRSADRERMQGRGNSWRERDLHWDSGWEERHSTAASGREGKGSLSCSDRWR